MSDSDPEMGSSALEELKLEIGGALYTLGRDALIEICDFLLIAGSTYENVKGKSRSALIAHVTRHLEREELLALEDQGMAELLSLRDKITELRQGVQTSEQNQASPGAAPGLGQKELVELSETERLRKELEMLKLSLSLSLHEKSNQTAKQTHGGEDNIGKQNVASVPQPPTNNVSVQWNREFKISGQIGEPGQKDKLTFSSLAHQIEQGINKGFPEIEIIDAVIRAIAPGLQLRSYLEGKINLTLPTLRRILRSHYQEKGATELYKQLTSEVQSNRETPQNFLIRALDLRQKILFASQEAESGLKYDPILVQSMFLHTVLTGLQNDSIRSDLQPYLQQSTTSDELLLEKLNIACANETERQDKKKLLTHQRPTSVHTVQSDDADKKE